MNWNTEIYIIFSIYQGLPSPSGRAQAAVSPPSQTFGQRFMGNMMGNLLVRSLTSKSKGKMDDVTPSSPVKVHVLSSGSY